MTVADRLRIWTAALALCALGFGGTSGCVSENVGSEVLALDAFCQADVIGTGLVEVETDYLPRVVNCENGAADFEALKAQAVTARSYLYYRLELTGDIEDGQGDQVYSCGREPTADHIRAVTETSGQVLRYQATQVAAFYVAGSLQSGPSCTGGTDDPTDTEKWVTYNSGKEGDNIEQTMLGFVAPSNHANRGCLSQNGSDCLAERGDDYLSMLRFYYGEDIEVELAEGPCVDAPVVGADTGVGEPMPANEGCGCRSGSGTESPVGTALFGFLLFVGFHARRHRLGTMRSN